MENYRYEVAHTSKGCQVTVTRLSDGATKSFTPMAAAKTEQARLRICNFMDSITDENCDGYFPRKKK